MADWLEARLRPQEGWGLFVLLFLTMALLVGAVAAAEWVPRDDVLTLLALVALLVGRWLGRWNWSRLAQVLAVIDGGILAALWAVAGRLEQVPDLLFRWGTWMRVALGQGTARDPIIFLLYAALLIWAAALFAGWWFARGRNGIPGFLPILVLSVLSTYYSGRGMLSLIGGLFCLLISTALGDLYAWQASWQEQEVDYVTDLDFNTTLSSGGVALALIVLCVFVPTIGSREFILWVQETFSRPSEQVEAEAGRLFGGVRPPRQQGEEDSPDAAAYLPRLHLLGGRPELEGIVVFFAWVDETQVPYWRGATYDYYTGGGWQMTVADEGPVTTTLPMDSAPVSRIVSQRVEFVRRGEKPLYALAEPSRFGVDAVALWHGPGDLAGLRASTLVYTVTSRVALPTPDELRAASVIYDPEIVEMYLQLPGAVPERVRALAQEVVSGGDTAYDRAVRLERYLRGFPYTLDVEAPPPDTDVADYFLFELGEGYCDYYATTFVVLARSVGIPARLAMGYVGGQTRMADGALVVVEANAHSWPEVYFPEWGWIRFEPTGARAELERFLTEEEEETPLEDLPERPRQPFRFPLWAVVIPLVIVVLVVGWRRWRGGPYEEPADLSSVWRWLVEEGAALGVPRRPDQTVKEYAAAVSEGVLARTAVARWRKGLWQARAVETGETLEAFAQAYSDYLYGGGPGQVKPAWVHLWRGVPRFRWVPLIRRRKR